MTLVPLTPKEVYNDQMKMRKKKDDTIKVIRTLSRTDATLINLVPKIKSKSGINSDSMLTENTNLGM